MMLRTTFIITLGLLVTISAFGYFFWYKPKFKPGPKNNDPVRTGYKIKDNKVNLVRMQQKAILAKDFVRNHGFNTTHCFLIDMRIPSGKKRFFVYNLRKDSVEIAGLVTHGSGSETGAGGLSFSNTPNSYCTSLGKYKMGQSYYGRFGLAYKMMGLENTNSKAFDRFVVLHGYNCVPENEIAPLPLCVSLGCPTVSPAFLTRLQYYLDRSAAPVLLWIYY